MPWTKEQAREMSVLSVASRKANGWQARAKRLLKPEPPPNSANAAQTRLFRLWACLETIDKRVATEVHREHPNLALIKELTTAARSLTAQALDLGGSVNGKKPGAKDQAPAMPEPEPQAE